MSVTLAKKLPQSGYTPCACRDCMDTTVARVRRHGRRARQGPLQAVGGPTVAPEAERPRTGRMAPLHRRPEGVVSVLTVVIDGRVDRQIGATLARRRWALELAREDSRDVQVWETRGRVSRRITH
jgi:hypothetical protein